MPSLTSQGFPSKPFPLMLLDQTRCSLQGTPSFISRTKTQAVTFTRDESEADYPPILVLSSPLPNVHDLPESHGDVPRRRVSVKTTISTLEGFIAILL